MTRTQDKYDRCHNRSGARFIPALADAVMDLPEVRASARLEATVPLGDGESLERTDDMATRPAGSTALMDGKIPPDGEPGSSQEHGERS